MSETGIPNHNSEPAAREALLKKQKIRRWMFYLSGTVTICTIIATVLESLNMSIHIPVVAIVVFFSLLAFLTVFIVNFELREVFRFSLLSVTVLTLTVSILLGMNMRGHWDLILSQETFNYGWPFPFLLTDQRFGNQFIAPMLFFDFLYFSNVLFFIKYICETLVGGRLSRR